MSADAHRLQVAVGGAGLGAAALALAGAVRAVHVAPAAAHRLDVAGLGFTYPAVNAAAAVLLACAALGAAVLIVAGRATWRQARAHRRLVRALPVTGPLPGGGDTWIVADAAPLAFCAGSLRPRVYVSTGALERLSEPELRAVLAHEQRHRAARDPLRLATGRVLAQALFFLPVLRPLHARAADVAELRADAAAVTVAGTGPLASAMLAFGAGPDGVAGISPERVDSLLGRPPAWRLPRLLLVAALVTVAAILALAWRAGASASVHASLALPVVSAQPCVLVLALVPVVAGLSGALARRGVD